MLFRRVEHLDELVNRGEVRTVSRSTITRANERRQFTLNGRVQFRAQGNPVAKRLIWISCL